MRTSPNFRYTILSASPTLSLSLSLSLFKNREEKRNERSLLPVTEAHKRLRKNMPPRRGSA